MKEAVFIAMRGVSGSLKTSITKYLVENEYSGALILPSITRDYLNNYKKVMGDYPKTIAESSLSLVCNRHIHLKHLVSNTERGIFILDRFYVDYFLMASLGNRYHELKKEYFDHNDGDEDVIDLIEYIEQTDIYLLINKYKEVFKNLYKLENELLEGFDKVKVIEIYLKNSDSKMIKKMMDANDTRALFFSKSTYMYKYVRDSFDKGFKKLDTILNLNERKPLPL